MTSQEEIKQNWEQQKLTGTKGPFHFSGEKLTLTDVRLFMTDPEFTPTFIRIGDGGAYFLRGFFELQPIE